MKTRILIIIALIIFGGFGSCKKEENFTPQYKQRAEIRILEGQWKISSFIINGIDHFIHYDSYIFHFDQNGIVRVTGIGNTKGEWATREVNDKPYFRLDFGETDLFNLLNNDFWTVVRQNSIVLEMKATRGDDGVQSVVFRRQ